MKALRVRRHQSIAFAVVGLISGLAIAQAPPTERVVQESDKTVYKKKTVIDFNEVAVDGELTKPEGSYTISKKKTTFRTLIKVRDNFNPELQRSADNL